MQLLFQEYVQSITFVSRFDKVILLSIPVIKNNQLGDVILKLFKGKIGYWLALHAIKIYQTQ